MALLSAAYAWHRYHRLRYETGQLEAIRRDLAVAEERYRSLFDYNPSAVFSVGLDARLTEANRAGEQLTGRSRSELLGMSLTDIVAPTNVDNALTSFAKALDREPQHIHTRIVGGQGELVEIEVTGLPIVVDETVVGVYVIASDIGGRKRLEGDLMRAQVAAEQASGAKDLLLANVSHEVRTPLTGLLGNLELLHDTELDPVQARFVATMVRSGDRLLSLVNEILDYTRLEAGKVVLATVPFDLPLVVSDVVALVGQSAENKGLYFKRRIDSELPDELVGDPARVAQVLTILLDNAVKFTDDRVGPPRRLRRTTGERAGHHPVRGERLGDRHADASPRPAVRGVQPGRPLDDSTTRRDGPRPDPLPPAGHHDGWAPSRPRAPGFGSAFTFTITFEEPEATTTWSRGSPRSQGRTLLNAGIPGSMPYVWSHKDRPVSPRS